MISGKMGKICCVPHGEGMKKINKWKILSAFVDRMLFVVYITLDLLLFLVFIIRPW